MLLSDEDEMKVDSSASPHDDGLVAGPSPTVHFNTEDEPGKSQEVPVAEFYENPSSWEAPQPQWQPGSVEATYSASPSPKDRFRREPGVMGLVNIGNTCFMNAGLQCLLNTPALVEFFLKPKPAFLKSSSLNPVLLYRIYSIFVRAWTTDIAAFDIRSFKECLAASYPQFEDSRQHDCQEFLALLLDLLHEQLHQCQVSSAAQRKLLLELLENGNNIQQDGEAELRRSLSYSGRIGCPPKSISPELRKKSRTSPTKRTSVSSKFPTRLLDGFYNKTLVVGRLFRRKRKMKNVNPLSHKSQFYLQYPNFGPSTLRQTLLDSDGEECLSAYYNINRDNWEKLDQMRNYGHCPRKRPRMNSTLEAKRKLNFMNLEHNGDSIEKSFPPVEEVAKHEIQQLQAPSEDCAKENIPNQNLTKQGPGEPLLDPASEFWKEHLKSNNTVIAKTFQGFLKSTVTCTACSYVSTVFEPFMYFSLPLPDIESTRRVLTIRLIRMNQQPIQCVPITNSYQLKSAVREIKSEIAARVSAKSSDPVNLEKLYMGSVCDFTITELSDDLQVQNIDDRNILYLYELNSNFHSVLAPIASEIIENNGAHLNDENWDNIENRSTEVSRNGKTDSSDGGYESSPAESKGIGSPDDVLPHHISPTPESPDLTGTNSPASNDEPWQVMHCRICYGNCQLSTMLQHSIVCVFCKGCVQKLDELAQSSDKSFKCPTPQCSLLVRISDFHVYKPQILGAALTQVTFRNVTSDSMVTTFGHPVIIYIPTCLPAKEFHGFMESINPFPGIPFQVYSSTQNGKCCAICDDIQCQGCTFPVVDNVYVRYSTQIVFLYSELDPKRIENFHVGDMPHEDLSYNRQDSSPRSYYRYEPKFDIHDCIREFAKEEFLDEDNHWLCPSCNCNKRASKKLSVCKFPDYLIIYLKRFVYENLSSQKLENEVTFPLVDLDLNAYVAEDVQGENKWKYDLYGCVSHSGTVSYGHYTAFTRNVLSHEWNYFNDRLCYKENINESCYSTAYILFYAKQGTYVDIPELLMTHGRTSPLSTSPSPGMRTESSCSMSLTSSNLGPFRAYGRSRHSSSQTQRSEEDYWTCTYSTSSSRSLDHSFDDSRGKSQPRENCKHHIRWNENGEDNDDGSTTSDSMPPLAEC